MANLPRFGRTWQRFSAASRPVPAAQSASEQEPAVTEPEITPAAPTTQSLQQFEPSPPPAASSPPSSPTREPTRLSSPAKKATSPTSSPKPRATATRVASPPIKSARSPPSPTPKRYDGGRRISPASSPKTTKTTPPPSPKYRQSAAPLSPLNLPRTQVKSADGTTTQSKTTPEVEQKSVLYQKIATVKPAKSDGKPEYGSGKPPQKQQAEVINVTGHNIGAVMEINKSSGGEMIRKKETEGSGYGNDERKTGVKDKNQKANELRAEVFTNNNFQGVNNSLLYDSSCNHRDPGLHLAISGEPDDEGTMVDGSKNSDH